VGGAIQSKKHFELQIRLAELTLPAQRNSPTVDVLHSEPSAVNHSLFNAIHSATWWTDWLTSALCLKIAKSHCLSLQRIQWSNECYSNERNKNPTLTLAVKSNRRTRRQVYVDVSMCVSRNVDTFPGITVTGQLTNYVPRCQLSFFVHAPWNVSRSGTDVLAYDLVSPETRV